MISDRDLLQAVTDATSDAYVVYGGLGREEVAGLALLALDTATNDLVVLMVNATTGPNGDVDLAVEVRTELEVLSPAVASTCVSCGSGLRPEGRFCPDCGHEAVGPAGKTDADWAEMRATVGASISGEYELLGEMRRKAGGEPVYFVREKSSGHLMPLRLSPGTTAGEFELAETPLFQS